MHKPKKIALFTGNYTTIADGVALTLNRLVKWLEAQGSEVMVFAPDVENPAIKAYAGTLVPITSIPMIVKGRQEYRIGVCLPKDAKKKLEAFQPDIIHLATPDEAGKDGLKFAKKHNIPVVSTYHTHFTTYLKYYKLGFLVPAMWANLRKFYNKCEEIYVPSESMAEVLRAEGIGVENTLRIWERGVEPDKFNPQKRDLAWRRSLGIADEELVITFVSRVVWEKNLEMFRDVILKLEQNGIPHKSLVVGDGPARAELAEMLPKTLFVGHQSGNDLAKCYASSDIFFFPSETETFGNVTLEAMASGLPCLVADATGSRGLVVQAFNGFLAPPHDLAVFYDYAHQLLTNEALRKQFAQNSLERSKLYAWEAILQKIDGYYDNVLGN